MNEDLSKIAGIPITETEVLEVRSRRCNEEDAVITVFSHFSSQKGDNVTTSTLLLRDVRSGGYAFELSSQIGCPIQCYFCGVQTFERSLLTQEILEQVALLVCEANKRRVVIRKPRKLSFTDGGELLLNPNCLDVVRKLVCFMEADIKISSVLPRSNLVKNNLHSLLLFKEEGFSHTLHLQISMSSTNEDIRQKASAIPLLPLEEIAEIGQSWHEVTGRKPTVSFTLTESAHCVAGEVSKILLPEHFRARLHPYRYNGIEGVETISEERLQELAIKFKEEGYEMIVGQFDPLVNRDDSLLFSGTLSYKDLNPDDQDSKESDPEDKDPENPDS